MAEDKLKGCKNTVIGRTLKTGELTSVVRILQKAISTLEDVIRGQKSSGFDSVQVKEFYDAYFQNIPVTVEDTFIGKNSSKDLIDHWKSLMEKSNKHWKDLAFVRQHLNLSASDMPELGEEVEKLDFEV